MPDNVPVQNFANMPSSIKISNFLENNDNISILDEKGPFKVIEYEKDLSVGLTEVMLKYFASKMNIRPRS